MARTARMDSVTGSNRLLGKSVFYELSSVGLSSYPHQNYTVNTTLHYIVLNNAVI